MSTARHSVRFFPRFVPNQTQPLTELLVLKNGTYKSHFFLQ